MTVIPLVCFEVELQLRAPNRNEIPIFQFLRVVYRLVVHPGCSSTFGVGNHKTLGRFLDPERDVTDQKAAQFDIGHGAFPRNRRLLG